MDLHHKTRWVFSPVVEHDCMLVPVAQDYAVLIEAPYIHNGHALCRCVFNAHGLAAASADARLIVCGSLHRRDRIHPRIAAHHAEHGLHDGMLLHEALETLGALHHGFLPEF